MNQNSAQELLRHFQAFLEEAKLSQISIKNYLSDVRLFLASIGFKTIRDIDAKAFQTYLQQAKETKPDATYRRYSASLRRFTTFLSIEYRLELALPKANDLESGPQSAHNLINQFRLYLTREKKSAATVKNYISDLNHFLSWIAKNSLAGNHLGGGRMDSPEVGLLTPTVLNDYFDGLKLSHTSTSVTDRRASTLRKFVQFSLDCRLISHNPFETAPPLPLIASLALAPLAKNPIRRDQTTNPIKKLYRDYHSLAFTPYLHLAILILATTALGIFSYAQIFSEAKPGQAYPTALVRPSRQLAFQGRLTDTDGRPITNPTNVTFKLFNQAESGTEVYSVPTCTVAPDQDGIFSTQIGNGTCGAEIGPEVFSENTGLFLEVAIGGQILTPRQPIATSGYALNSETLQGYPASASATENTVPVVNTDGDIIIGAASPALISQSGTFAIKGQAVTLATATGTDGDVTVAPDGRGSVNLIGSLDKGIFLDVTDANLTTGTLIEGYVANNSRTGTLLHLASGTKQVNRLTISTTGQTDIIADTYAKPAFSIKQTGSGPIFKALAGKTTVGQLSTTGDLGLLGGLTLGSPFTTHAWPGQIITNSNSRGMAGTIINQNDSGPIFAASSSGTPRFVIANNGSVGINTINPTEGALVVSGRTWTDEFTMAKRPVSGYILTSDNGGNATWSDPNSVGRWTLAGTTLYPNSTTYNTLIGDTATASAVAKLSVVGDISSTTLDTAGGVIYGDVNGVLNVTAQGTGGECLTSGGSGTPVWVSCSVASNNYWQRNGGALQPGNLTDDILLGSTATTSARIALINVASGTPTASLSASPTGATYLTAAGNLATTNNQSLTIGAAGTGNIILAPGGVTALTAIGNDVTLADTLTINGSSVTLAGNDTVVDMTGTGTLSLNTVTNRAITTGTGQITLAGNVDATNGLDVTTANLTVGGANFTVAPATGDITTAGDAAINGGDITTTATTFNLLSGATTALNIGPSGAVGSLALSGGSADTGCTLDGTTGNYTCSGNITTTATSGVQGWWQRNSQALSPTYITDDLLTGATATASALIKLSGTSGNNSWINTGNFGIATTTPGEKLDVNGNATVS
ncbi:MAG: site-specific integrase, partial [Patescibacteria group bacterium]